MNRLDKLRSRYLRDPLPVRLGGLAANLARVASFSQDARHQPMVVATLQESKWFIEWIAAELEKPDTAELVRLQVQIAIWQLQFAQKWQDNHWRSELALKCQQWSQRLLQMSGLQLSEKS